MRVLLLTLVVLTAIGAGLVAGSLDFESVRTETSRAMSTAPDLTSYVATAAGEKPGDTAARVEYCGSTRLAVVRRVTRLGEAEALSDILPPIRWEAWPEVVRACDAAYGPLTSLPPFPRGAAKARPS